MKNIVALLLIVMSSVSINTYADDLVGMNKTIEVNRETINGVETIGFRYCYKEFGENVCDQIGNKARYSIGHLKALQETIKNMSYIQNGKAAVGVAAGVAIGVAIGLPVLAFSGSVAALGVATVGGVGVGALATMTGMDGAIKKHKKKNLINNQEFLNDEDIEMEDKDIEEAAELLRDILDTKPENLAKTLGRELLGGLFSVLAND
jgi:hypothetical protein